MKEATGKRKTACNEGHYNYYSSWSIIREIKSTNIR